MPVITPWATMPKIAAWMPIVVSVAMPSMTKPMWPTELNAISRFKSFWARQARAAYTIAIAASAPIHGA